MTAKKSEQADQLIDEFKSLVADAEALIKATQDHPSETIGNLRNNALETISGAKEKDRKSTRLNSSHIPLSRMPSSA